MRDDDIPDLVQEDVCDLGLVGLNVLEERRLEMAARGATAQLRDAATPGLRALPAVAGGARRAWHGRTCPPSPGCASPPPIRRCWAISCSAKASGAEIVTLSGAVEIAPRLGRADMICDLVSSGSTLQANHLREVHTILESQVVLIRTPVRLPQFKEDWISRLLLRIDGVEQVKESKYIMLHAPRSALPRIRELLPGSESPTIIPLEGSADKVAVHAVCRENVFWETLESLKAAGASALLVLPVEKMLS